jgi:hypothetical protein
MDHILYLGVWLHIFYDKSAKICDFLALHFLKSTTYSESSITHLLIHPELSLL